MMHDGITGISIFITGSLLSLGCALALHKKPVVQVISQVVFIGLVAFFYMYMLT